MRHLFRISLPFPMLQLTLAGMMAVVCLVSPAMGQGDLLENGQAFLAKVGADEDSGLLSPEQAMLLRFQFIFAPGDLPAGYRVQRFSPLKCGTDLVRHFQEVKEELDDETRRMIESFLDLPASRFTYLSPEGHFQLNYDVTGVDAVPALDTDPANGIPDFVEEVGRYLEQSWTVQVPMSGFVDPLASAPPCPVSFREMQNYGYSYIISENLGTTGLVLHCNFQGFPPNDDPDGDARGAAKVTAAHELKHASQYRGSRWSEEGWIELDAVWAEELVFDLANDYYNYLLGGSPIRHPEHPLDSGPSGTGSYEDCVFQIWMQETWGVQLVVDFWHRRTEHPGEPVLQTYRQVLLDHGADLAEAWGTFTAWNHATGYRAVPGVGYGEAAHYPYGTLTASLDEYPAEVEAGIEHLAASCVRLTGFEASETGNLIVEFSGTPGDAPLNLTFVVQRRDGTGLMETMNQAGEARLAHTLSVPLQEIEAVGIVIGNPDLDGPARGFQLAVSKDILPLPAELHLVTTQLQVQLATGTSTQTEALITSDGPPGSVLNYRVSVWNEDPQGLISVLRSGQASPPGQRDDLSFQVTSPEAGQLVPVGTPVTVAWDQDTFLETVLIHLSRDAGQQWQLLGEVPAAEGSWDFIAEGPASLDCLVKVTAADQTAEALSPGLFTIYPAADLMTCVWPWGQVAAGDQEPVSLNCDASGFDPGDHLCWVLIQHDGGGLPGTIPVTVRVLPGISPAPDVPLVTALAGSCPNPFNPLTVIQFQLGKAGPVSLDILDVRGHRVRRLLAETRTAGVHRLPWNGRDDQDRSLPSGVYLVRLAAPGFQDTAKLVLAR
jgi:hypothetical protein